MNISKEAARQRRELREMGCGVDTEESRQQLEDELLVRYRQARSQALRVSRKSRNNRYMTEDHRKGVLLAALRARQDWLDTRNAPV